MWMRLSHVALVLVSYRRKRRHEVAQLNATDVVVLINLAMS